MDIWVHVLVSGIVSIALFPKFGWFCFAAIAGGVLIDVDHLIWYMFRFRRFDISGCYKYCTAETYKNNFKDVKGQVFIFHTVEFLAACMILSYFSDLMLMFTAGLIVHYILDLIWYQIKLRRLILDHSIIHYYMKNSSLHKKQVKS